MKFKVDKEGDLLDHLIREVGYATKTRARTALKKGMIRVDGETVKKADSSLKPGSTVEVGPPASEIENQEPTLVHTILFEDDHYVAVLKPVKKSVKGGKGKSLISEVDAYIKAQTKHTQRAFLLHVIDREASGIVVFAKTFRAQKAFQEYWKDAVVRYYAVIEGQWNNPNNKIEHNLRQTPTGLVVPSKKGERATMMVEALNVSSNYSLLRLEPHTREKGQIRAQLAAEGHPILGDKRFHSIENPLNSLALHLFHIEMKHPLNEGVLELKTPVPRNFLALVKGRKLR